LPEVSEIIDSLLHSDSDDFDVESELAKITKPQTKPGEIIKLGPHRLLCGDSTKAKDLQKLMGDKQAQLIFTDPPYAVNYRGGAVGKDCTKGKLKKGKKHWDDMTATSYEQLLVKSLSNAYELSNDKAVLYIWFASSRIDSVIKSLKASRWEKRNLLIWFKNTFAGSLFAQYKHRYEPCFYCFKKGKSTRWFGPNNETTIWECNKPHRNTDHPTIKPLALAMRAIRNSSTIGNLVLDMFLGSGTTLIAADRMNRVCYGIEREPIYCDLVRQRYEIEHPIS